MSDTGDNKKAKRRRLLQDCELVDLNGLSIKTHFSPRTLQGWKDKGVIPYLAISPRVHLFEPNKVMDALRRFEVKEVS